MCHRIHLLSLLFICCSLWPGCKAPGETLDRQTAAQLAQLEWLCGRWYRSDLTRPGRSGTETWQREEDQTLRGKGVLMQGRDTVFQETLRIVARGSSLYFVANTGSHSAPVYFRIVASDRQHFICTNPEHDFPQEIAYYLESEGELRAVASAGDKKQHFSFRKTEDLRNRTGRDQ